MQFKHRRFTQETGLQRICKLCKPVRYNSMVETWKNKDQTFELEGFKVFIKVKSKSSKYGRAPSGLYIESGVNILKKLKQTVGMLCG